MNNIVLSSDEKYLPFLYTTIYSVLKSSNETSTLAFHIIVDFDLGNTDLDHFNKLEKSFSTKIIFLQFNKSLVLDYPISKHVSISTYYRIFIPEILQNLSGKILYLDSDLLILGEIVDLFKSGMSKPIAAVAEPTNDRFIELGLPKTAQYFNAGILMIDLDLWREFDFTRQTIEYINLNREKLLYWDQDALNYIFINNWDCFDTSWNLTTDWIDSHKIISDPKIVHFTGSIKPWDYRSMNPYTDLYREHFKASPYRGRKLENRNFKSILTIFLRKRLNLPLDKIKNILNK